MLYNFVMKWDFTPDDVLKGKAHYSVAEFRDDLLREIGHTAGKHRDGEKFTRFYAVITVTLCTSLALGQSMDGFALSVQKFFPDKALQKELTRRKLLDQMRDDNEDNIRMLRAVIRKRIKDDVSIGIDPECVTRTVTSEMMAF